MSLKKIKTSSQPKLCFRSLPKFTFNVPDQTSVSESTYQSANFCWMIAIDSSSAADAQAMLLRQYRFYDCERSFGPQNIFFSAKTYLSSKLQNCKCKNGVTGSIYSSWGARKKLPHQWHFIASFYVSRLFVAQLPSTHRHSLLGRSKAGKFFWVLESISQFLLCMCFCICDRCVIL